MGVIFPQANAMRVETALQEARLVDKIENNILEFMKVSVQDGCYDMTLNGYLPMSTKLKLQEAGYKVSENGAKTSFTISWEGK